MQGDGSRGWLRRSLRASLFEGALAEIVGACAGGGLVTAWAIELGCAPFMLAFFGALPALSKLVHLPASWFTARRHRRKLALVSLTSSRQLLLGLALLPLLPLSDRATQGAFAVIVGLSSLLGVVGNSAWMSWMGDIVPRRASARYFSLRSTWATVAGASGAVVAGLVLDAARRVGEGERALAGLSIVAWVAGVFCSILIARQSDPGPSRQAASLRPSALAQPWKCRKARPVLAYELVWNAGVGVSASFFGLFLLVDLRLGFAFIALHGAVTAGVRALATPLWGRAIDRVGTRPVLATTSFGLAVLPILWLMPTRHDFVLPLAVDALAGGLMWAGHGVASFQLPFVVSKDEKRPFYFAAFASTGGGAFAVSALVAGAVFPTLPLSFSLGGSQFRAMQGLFLLSAALRLVAWALSLRVNDADAAPVPELWRGLSWWPSWLRVDRLRKGRWQIPARA